MGETLSRGGADFTGLGVLVYDQNSPQHRAIPAAEAQGWVNNRSVMPLDAVRLHARYNGGSQTCAAERFRYYMGETPPRLGLYRVKPATNKEFLVSAGHNPAEISLLLFVHTARRSYRLGCGLSCLGMPIYAPNPLRVGPLPGHFSHLTVGPLMSPVSHHLARARSI